MTRRLWMVILAMVALSGAMVMHGCGSSTDDGTFEMVGGTS